MGKAPAFQFYAQDFLIGTSRFTLEERGAYITLICNSWEHGALSTDLGDLARMCGITVGRFRVMWSRVLQAKWVEMQEGLVNLKLEEVRADQGRYASSQAENGRRGGLAKAQRRASELASDTPSERLATLLANGQPESSSSVFDLRSSDPDPGKDRQDREAPKASPADLRDLWNARAVDAGLPICQELSDTRKRAAQARLREAPLAVWAQVVDRIAASDFCRGLNDRGWVADFDWLLQPGTRVKPSTRVKVLEGKYDNRQVRRVEAIPRFDPDVRALCERAGLSGSEIAHFAGARLVASEDGLTLVVPDADVEAFIRRHYLERLEAAARRQGVDGFAVRSAA